MNTADVPIYGKIPREIILTLKPMAGHLLTVITCLINRHTNSLERSLSALAADANMGKDSLIKYTGILEIAGYIKVKRKPGGKHDDVNIYSLCGLLADVAMFSPVEMADSTSRTDRQQRSEKSTAEVGETDTDYIDSLDSEEEDENDKNIFSSDSDSGEQDLPGEGDDPTLPEQDAPLRMLEEMGITGNALEAARLYPERIAPAFELAKTKTGIQNKKNYICKVLINGIYDDDVNQVDKKSDASNQKQSWMTGNSTYESSLGNEVKQPPEIESDPSIYIGRWQGIKDQLRTSAQVWNATYNQLELQLDRNSFDTWLKDARLINMDDDVFVVLVRNSYAKDMLQHRLYRNVRRVLSDVIGEHTDLRFVIASDIEIADLSDQNADLEAIS